MGPFLKIARVKPVLTTIHPKLIQRFCEVPEKEIALYAYLRKIEFQSTSCPYARTALRNDTRTMLNRMEVKHGGVKFTIFKSVERMKPALEVMVKEARMKDCKICGEPTVGEICKPCQMLQHIDRPD